MERPTRRSVRIALLLTAGLLVALGAVGPAQAGTAPEAPSAVHPEAAVHPVLAPDPSPSAPTGDVVSGVLRGAAVPHNSSADVSRFLAAHAQRTGAPRTLAGGGARAADPVKTIHPAQGIALLNHHNPTGASATHSVAPGLTITHPGSTVYVPTLYPASGACIEVSTRYVQGTRDVAAWDWCGSINFAASVRIDEDFVAKYTKADAYRVRIVQTDSASNTWTASLYNVQKGVWDTLFTSGGTSQGGAGGWDIYELYSGVDAGGDSYVCGDLHDTPFEASAIMVLADGQWAPASPDNADTHYDQPSDNFDCPGHQYQLVNEYDHWRATG